MSWLLGLKKAYLEEVKQGKNSYVSFKYNPPNPLQRSCIENAAELVTEGGLQQACVRSCTIWDPSHSHADLEFQPCINGNPVSSVMLSPFPTCSHWVHAQGCRPTRSKLDPDGPVPIKGIGGSDLLWGVWYRCSKCVGAPKSESDRPSLREFSTITQEAIASHSKVIRTLCVLASSR
jgi:hypothetical protein